MAPGLTAVSAEVVANPRVTCGEPEILGVVIIGARYEMVGIVWIGDDGVFVDAARCGKYGGVALVAAVAFAPWQVQFPVIVIVEPKRIRRVEPELVAAEGDKQQGGDQRRSILQ